MFPSVTGKLEILWAHISLSLCDKHSKSISFHVFAFSSKTELRLEYKILTWGFSSSHSPCLQKLQDYLARFSRQYDQLVAFKPTGWTFSQQVDSVEDIQPEISGNISIYGMQ